MATKTAICHSISQAEIESWNGEIEVLEYSDSEFQMWREGSSVDSAIIKFTTPSFTGFSKTVDIILGAYGNPNMTSPACYALCSSDQNVSLYADSTSVVNDPNQLSTGTVYIEGYIKLSIKTNKLESEKEYYLIIWFPSDFDSDTWDARIYDTSYHTIKINYAQEAFIYDSSQGVYAPYQCFIDTEYAEYGHTLSCNALGQRSFMKNLTVNTSSLVSDYNITDAALWGYSRASGGGAESYSYHLKFQTPSTIDDITRIVFKLKMNSSAVQSNPIVRYALCTSDENYSLYASLDSQISDDNQINVGTFEENFEQDGFSIITIEGLSLSPNTVYYLIIWDTNRSDGQDSYTYVQNSDNHDITVFCEYKDGPICKSKFELYTPYMDNGTTWEQF